MTKNLGGRVQLEFGATVRYLDTNGCVSKDEFTIDSKCTDFRARATLKSNDGSVILVHYDKILPVNTVGKVVAVLGEKVVTITCPNCLKTLVAVSGQKHFICCSERYEVFFMSNTVNEVQAESAFDLEGLKSRFEVWVKDGAKFNATIELKTVQLVILGDNPRKTCFNLYDGKLSKGGKAADLRLDDFANGTVENDKKPFWYKIDPEKYAKQLTAKQYVKL